MAKTKIRKLKFKIKIKFTNEWRLNDEGRRPYNVYPTRNLFGYEDMSRRLTYCYKVDLIKCIKDKLNKTKRGYLHNSHLILHDESITSLCGDMGFRVGIHI